MERTTIVLPHEIKALATARSRQLGVSFAEFVRQALQDALGKTNSAALADPLFQDTAVFDDRGESDWSEKHDAYLYG